MAGALETEDFRNIFSPVNDTKKHTLCNAGHNTLAFPTCGKGFSANLEFLRSCAFERGPEVAKALAECCCRSPMRDPSNRSRALPVARPSGKR